MNTITKLERTVLHWFKTTPHLPSNIQRWLGENIWWITIILAIVTGLAALGNLFTILNNQSAMSNGIASYYASTSFLVWSSFIATVNLVFNGLTTVILAFAVTALRDKQKKGWVLLFLAWLVSIVFSVFAAILTLNVVGFILSLLFSGLSIIISGYILFEIHGEFAHVERSKGVKRTKKAQEK